MIRPLVAGNWKMNGLRASASEAVRMHESLKAAQAGCDVMLCPPATLLGMLAKQLDDGPIALGGQDCHVATAGAHTGDLAPEMLKDVGASAVIVGHSERRADHGELSANVRVKAAAAHRAGLTAIICVGETAGERHADLTLTVVERQLKDSMPDEASATNTIVAYEPVWAIGTGLTPTPADVEAVHGALRSSLQVQFSDGDDFRLLYGGSVKPSNAKELMAVANVNGALVGGASLKADDFLGIIRTYD